MCNVSLVSLDNMKVSRMMVVLVAVADDVVSEDFARSQNGVAAVDRRGGAVAHSWHLACWLSCLSRSRMEVSCRLRAPWSKCVGPQSSLSA